ncbi:MAG TPA: hypothetical protein VM262_08110, partial [Acidimicrobiales bacterium]|nr:hypothetical protein [Acidimicrobiales bacterium]
MTIDTVRTTRGLFRDDGGFAMVAALLSIMVAGLLGAVVMQLSIHTTQGSAHDRARTQSVHAAEAGLDQVLAMFRSSGGVTLPCELSGTLTATPPATWSAVITYYPAYPLLDAPMTCTGGYL